MSRNKSTIKLNARPPRSSKTGGFSVGRWHKYTHTQKWFIIQLTNVFLLPACSMISHCIDTHINIEWVSVLTNIYVSKYAARYAPPKKIPSSQIACALSAPHPNSRAGIKISIAAYNAIGPTVVIQHRMFAEKKYCENIAFFFSVRKGHEGSHDCDVCRHLFPIVRRGFFFGSFNSRFLTTLFLHSKLHLPNCHCANSHINCILVARDAVYVNRIKITHFCGRFLFFIIVVFVVLLFVWRFWGYEIF